MKFSARQPLAHTPNPALNKRKKTSELDKQLLDPSPAPKLRRVSLSESPERHAHTTERAEDSFSPLSPGSSTLVLEDTPRGDPMNVKGTKLAQELVSRQLYTPGKGHATPLKRAVIKRDLSTAYTSDAEAGPSTKPQGTEAVETNPRETNPQGTNPQETNPRETNPQGTKPVETNPRETNPRGTNPQGTKPLETKAVERRNLSPAVERRNLSPAVEKAAGIEVGSAQAGGSAPSTGGPHPGKAAAGVTAGSAQAGGSATSTGGTHSAQAGATAPSTGGPGQQPAAPSGSEAVQGGSQPTGATASGKPGENQRRNPVEGNSESAVNTSCAPTAERGNTVQQNVNKDHPTPSISVNMTDPTVLKYRVTVAEAIQFSLEEQEDNEMLG